MANIKVVGVGGAGLNAVNRMIDAGIPEVEFVAINTEFSVQLRNSDAPTKPTSAPSSRAGLGSGAPDRTSRGRPLRPDQARAARFGHGVRDRGRGRGTGSAPPPWWHGFRASSVRSRSGSSRPLQVRGLARAAGRGGHGSADPATRPSSSRTTSCSRCSTWSTSMIDAFRIADDVLRQGVQGICDLITVPGLINLDFADVRTIMTDADRAHGHRVLHQRHRAREAAERAPDRPSSTPRSSAPRASCSDRRRRGSVAARGQRGGGDRPSGLHRRNEHHLRRDDRRAAAGADAGHRRRDGDRRARRSTPMFTTRREPEERLEPDLPRQPTDANQAVRAVPRLPASGETRFSSRVRPSTWRMQARIRCRRKSPLGIR